VDGGKGDDCAVAARALTARGPLGAVGVVEEVASRAARAIKMKMRATRAMMRGGRSDYGGGSSLFLTTVVFTYAFEHFGPFFRGVRLDRISQDSLAMQWLRHGQGYYRQQNYCLDTSIKAACDLLASRSSHRKGNYERMDSS
jgi:hypothetical protein